MLPGDYIALRLTGETTTTISGLSEGIMWDFAGNDIGKLLLKHYHIPESFIPRFVPTFGDQGIVTTSAAAELGIKPGIPVTYRAGDQPNNAFSLNVLEPGEVAATAGTSGVMYGVTDKVKVDKSCRVNIFAHVNHTTKRNRLGVLLCVNGTGIANAWTKRLLGESIDYEEINRLAASVPIGSDGLIALPFGNGAERVLCNTNLGGMLIGMQYNRHTKAHVCRAVQEGIAFALNYGLEVMRDIGVKGTEIRAGKANMFLSKLFRDTIAGTSRATIELYNTDGAQGAARGAGLGVGIYANAKEAFKGLKLEETVKPAAKDLSRYKSAYERWKRVLEQELKINN